MALSQVLEHIDGEIARLQQARSLLTQDTAATLKPRRGRPKGSKNAVPSEFSLAAKTRGERKPSQRP